MDDDQNRSLDFAEFKKGIRDYGLYLEPKVICCQKIVVTNSFTFSILCRFTDYSNSLSVGITRDVQGIW